jgi:uroporphyrinogen decarboxylase
MGGIDKRVLVHGPGAIDAELERVRPAVEKGRYIPDLDHLIPDDVSWENYLYYVQALKRLVGKE